MDTDRKRNHELSENKITGANKTLVHPGAARQLRAVHPAGLAGIFGGRLAGADPRCAAMGAV